MVFYTDVKLMKLLVVISFVSYSCIITCHLNLSEGAH